MREVVLQTFALPETHLPGDLPLYAWLHGDVRRECQKLHFGAGGTVHFDTYVNLFSYRKWSEHCLLDGVILKLCGEGRVRLRLTHIAPDENETTLCDARVLLCRAGVLTDIAALLSANVLHGGLIALHLYADAPARLDRAEIVTTTNLPPKRLAIGITSFHRDAQVEATAARICRFIADEELQSRLHLYVVDNGQSLQLRPCTGLTLIPNRNLGGAGGFARVLAEARQAGFDYCLFADDDAHLSFDSLRRTLAFIDLARRPDAALAGAMLTLSEPHKIWEEGAFRRDLPPALVRHRSA